MFILEITTLMLFWCERNAVTYTLHHSPLLLITYRQIIKAIPRTVV